MLQGLHWCRGRPRVRWRGSQQMSNRKTESRLRISWADALLRTCHQSYCATNRLHQRKLGDLAIIFTTKTLLHMVIGVCRIDSKPNLLGNPTPIPTLFKWKINIYYVCEVLVDTLPCNKLWCKYHRELNGTELMILKMLLNLAGLDICMDIKKMLWGFGGCSFTPYWNQ